MLPIQSVLYEMLPRRNVTIRKCTIRNVTDPYTHTNMWGASIVLIFDCFFFKYRNGKYSCHVYTYIELFKL